MLQLQLPLQLQLQPLTLMSGLSSLLAEMELIHLPDGTA